MAQLPRFHKVLIYKNKLFCNKGKHHLLNYPFHQFGFLQSFFRSEGILAQISLTKEKLMLRFHQRWEWSVLCLQTCSTLIPSYLAEEAWKRGDANRDDINLALCLCVYFWLRWVFVAACRLSPAAVSGGCSPAAACGLLITAPSSVAAQALECRLSSCGARG